MPSTSLTAAPAGGAEAARSLLGPRFLFGDDSRQWREEWWYSRTTTVYGGSAEVQRGIIADRVLNLPKD